MFIVEGRTVGVVAALGAALLMVALDAAFDASQTTDPGRPVAIATAQAASLHAMHHRDDSPVSGWSAQASAPGDRVRLGATYKSDPLHGPRMRHSAALAPLPKEKLLASPRQSLD